MCQNTFAAAGGAYSKSQTPYLDLGEGRGRGREGGKGKGRGKIEPPTISPGYDSGGINLFNQFGTQHAVSPIVILAL